jgi:hypothetical protein
MTVTDELLRQSRVGSAHALRLTHEEGPKSAAGGFRAAHGKRSYAT